MTLKLLEEDFRRMGFSPAEICESMPHVSGSDEEAYFVDEDEEEDFEDVYLSDMVDETDSDMGEGAYQKTHKMSSKAKRAAKLWRKQNPGSVRKSNKKQAKRRHKPAYKAQMARIKPGTIGKSTGRRRVIKVSDVANPGGGLPAMNEELLQELSVLAESIRHEPVSRFDEFVEAFNHIADLGEMTAMNMMEEDEDGARELLSVSLKAEAVLKDMEDMDGALDADEDRMLEATLADALQDVGELFESYGLLDEDDWDEDEDLEEEYFDSDNPFLAAAASLKEAKGKRKRGRMPAPEKRKIIPAGTKGKTVTTASNWGKKNKRAGASRRQISKRGDVRNVEGLLGYLKKVKAGKVAPGQPMAMSKSGKKLNKGARAAQKVAGTYKGA